jgi:predicted HicB family RNase H-like nuclease
MSAKYTEAQAKAIKEYLKNFEDIKVRVPKGKRDEYRKLALEKGYSSLNQFIIDAIEKMK